MNPLPYPALHLDDTQFDRTLPYYQDIGELLMHNKVFNGSEVYRPAGVENTFVRLKDGQFNAYA